MKTISLVQGSPEWLAHRLNYGNASEAGAMLGLDGNTSRTELLDMKKSGLSKEFTEFTQKMIFDKGHAVEAAARPIVESLIGEDLYQNVGIEGNKSASFDGLTILEDIIFECKQWNEALAEMVRNNTVPDSHMPQLQQQLMLSGAEKNIFVIAKGIFENQRDDNGQVVIGDDGYPVKVCTGIEDYVYTEVTPSIEWFERINSGWTQFFIDLETHVISEKKAAAVANPISALPSPFIKVTGSVEDSNLPIVLNAAENFIANINLKLVTDQDFADAEQTVKFCKDAETKLEAAKEQTLAQTSSIAEAMQTIDSIKDQLRVKRLQLDKLVKAEKENRKQSIILAAKSAWLAHVEAKRLILGWLLPELGSPDFADAMKGKKLLSAMQNAVDTLLANSKVSSNIEVSRIADNLHLYEKEAENYEFLFNDLNQIITLEIKAFDATVKNRISEYKVAEEARIEAERIRAEEQRAKEEEQSRASTEAKPIETPQDERQSTEVQQPEETKVYVERQHTANVKADPFKAWQAKYNLPDSAMNELYAILNQRGANAA